MTIPYDDSDIIHIGQSNNRNYVVIQHTYMKKYICWIGIDDIYKHGVLSDEGFNIHDINYSYLITNEPLSELFESEWFVIIPIDPSMKYFSKFNTEQPVMTHNEMVDIIDVLTYHVVDEYTRN